MPTPTRTRTDGFACPCLDPTANDCLDRWNPGIYESCRADTSGHLTAKLLAWNATIPAGDDDGRSGTLGSSSVSGTAP